MEAGKTLEWEFPEFPGSFSVRLKSIKPHDSIIFEWDGDRHPLTVTIMLKSMDLGESTLVTVEEKEMDNNEEGLQWLKNNTAGYIDFLKSNRLKYTNKA